MKKIIITESQARTIINELFSDKLQQNLIQKFQTENPKLEDRVIRFYIDRFQQLKNGPKIQEKDITKYTWKQLETIVDVNQPKSYDKNIKISDSDLIYNQNGLKVFLANSEKACVTYGNGYSFCISARSEDNMYSAYRFGEGYTVYFVLDENKTKKTKPDGKFVNPTHLIVLMVKKREGYVKFNQITDKHEPWMVYQVTTANNDGETTYNDWDEELAYDYPRLKKLQKLFVTHEPNPKEKQAYELFRKYSRILNNLYDYYTDNEDRIFPPGDDYNFLVRNLNYLDLVNKILNNNIFYVYIGFSKLTKEIIITQTKTKYIDPNEWRDEKNNEMTEDIINDDYLVGEVEVKEKTPSKQYRIYLEKVREIMLEYLHEKNKLNYQEQ